MRAARRRHGAPLRRRSHPADSRLSLPRHAPPESSRMRGAEFSEVAQCDWGHSARSEPGSTSSARRRSRSLRRLHREPTHWASGAERAAVVPPGVKVCSAEQRRRTPRAFASGSSAWPPHAMPPSSGSRRDGGRGAQRRSHGFGSCRSCSCGRTNTYGTGTGTWARRRADSSPSPWVRRRIVSVAIVGRPNASRSDRLARRDYAWRRTARTTRAPPSTVRAVVPRVHSATARSSRRRSRASPARH